MDKGIIAANINASFRCQTTAFFLFKFDALRWKIWLWFKEALENKMQSGTIPWNGDFKHPG